LISGSVQENQQRAAASAPHDLRPYGGLDCRLRKTGTLEAFSPEPNSGCNRVAEEPNGKSEGDKNSDGGQKDRDLNEKGQAISPCEQCAFLKLRSTDILPCAEQRGRE